MSPDPVFRVRALSVEDPFAGPALRRYDVGRLCSEVDAEFVQDALASVDPERSDRHHRGRRDACPTTISSSRSARSSDAPYAGGITFRGLEDAEAVHGLIQDVELGAVESVVFVVPERHRPGRCRSTSWPS